MRSEDAATGSRLRVLELSSGWTSAAVCGRLLAEIGAEVTRFEQDRGGTDRSSTSRPQSRLDRTLDHLKEVRRARPADLTAYLADGNHGADVVLLDDTWRRKLSEPGNQDATISVAAPVVAYATPYGLTHAETLGPGNELTTQASAAILAVTGHPDAPPTRAGVALAAGAGGLNAATAILAAVRRHQRAGTEAVLDLADVDTLVLMQGNFLPSLLATGEPPPRVGNVQLLSAPWNAYPTSDGEVVIAAISERLWERLLRAMERTDLIGRPDLIGKANRVEHRDEVDGAISAWTSRLTSTQVVDALLEAGVPVSDVATIPTVLQAPFTAERGLVEEMDGLATLGPLLGRTEPSGSFTSREEPSASDKPLGGVRVLELGGHTAGGMATRLLADLGADVIKVELPQGDNSRTTVPILEDGHAHLWHFWNVGKRSAVVDFTTELGHEAFLRLVGQADVVLQNMAPDTADRLGIGPDDLLTAQPGLIYCSVSGFGYHGSQRSRRGFDAVLQAAGGIMGVTGDSVDRPVKTGPSVVDTTTAMASATAITAAILCRDESGRGQVVDLGLYDVAVWLTAELWPQVWDGRTPRPMGTEHPLHPLDGLFETADNRLLALGDPGASNRDEALSHAGIPSIEDRADWVAERSLAESLATCRAAGIPAVEALDLAGLVSSDLVQERDLLVPLQLASGGTCQVVGSPFRFHGSGCLQAHPRRVPDLGEHTTEVLSSIAGIDVHELATLEEAAVTRPNREHQPQN